MAQGSAELVPPWPAGTGLGVPASVPTEKSTDHLPLDPHVLTQRRLDPIGVEKGVEMVVSNFMRRFGAHLEALVTPGRQPAGESRLCRCGAVVSHLRASAALGQQQNFQKHLWR